MRKRMTSPDAYLLALFALGADNESDAVPAERIQGKVDHWVELGYLEADGENYKVTEGGQTFFDILRDRARRKMEERGQ